MTGMWLQRSIGQVNLSVSTTLELNRELSQGKVSYHDAICGSQRTVTFVVSNNISETNNQKEVKSKKACRFIQFSNNFSLHHMPKGLTSTRELWMEHKQGLNGGELLIELELRTKGAWCKDSKKIGATAWSRRSDMYKEIESRIRTKSLSYNETLDQL